MDNWNKEKIEVEERFNKWMAEEELKEKNEGKELVLVDLKETEKHRLTYAQRVSAFGWKHKPRHQCYSFLAYWNILEGKHLEVVKLSCRYIALAKKDDKLYSGYLVLKFAAPSIWVHRTFNLQHEVPCDDQDPYIEEHRIWELDPNYMTHGKLPNKKLKRKRNECQWGYDQH